MKKITIMDIREYVEESLLRTKDVINNPDNYSKEYVSKCIGRDEALLWVLQMINVAKISEEE